MLGTQGITLHGAASGPSHIALAVPGEITWCTGLALRFLGRKPIICVTHIIPASCITCEWQALTVNVPDVEAVTDAELDDVAPVDHDADGEDESDWPLADATNRQSTTTCVYFIPQAYLVPRDASRIVRLKSKVLDRVFNLLILPRLLKVVWGMRNAFKPHTSSTR